MVLTVTSCTTPAMITYMKDIQYGQTYNVKPAPELRAQRNDQLEIQVFSSDPTLAEPFNTGALVQDGVGITKPATYIVDAFGCIDFPVLGSLPVEGLTLKEIQNDIANRIKGGGYIKEPIVKVGLANFSITVLKYGSTQKMTISEPSINLLQVVVPAEQEKIKDVMVIRTENGKQTAYSVNYLTRDMFDSPVFYLQQNDIVYIKPTGWRQSRAMQNLMQIFGTAMSIVNTVSSIMIWDRLAGR